MYTNKKLVEAREALVKTGILRHSGDFEKDRNGVLQPVWELVPADELSEEAKEILRRTKEEGPVEDE